MLSVFIQGKKKIAYGLLFFQLFQSVFFSASSIAKALEDSDRVNTVSGIQSLIQDPGNNSKDISQSAQQGTSSLFFSQQSNFKYYPHHLPISLDEKRNIKILTHSLPELGSPKTLSEEKHEEQLASIANQVGAILSSQNAVDASIGYAKSIGEGLINKQINDWLSQYGKARISISADKKISGGFLLPVIDNPNSLLFTQLGFRNNSNRNTLNFGLGYRHYWGEWMYGFNTFYDYDYTGGNARLGMGSEAWRDYLKLAANGYFGLTDWHQSTLSVMNDYDERPVSGFDVRAEVYLPAYPQFSGSIKYEKYFGKGVHLSSGVDPKQLKDDPQSLILGLNYTPIPLLTIKGERAIGERNDTKISLDVNYRLGVPLFRQLDPDSVDGMRSLVGNKYDFVDRNYDIVMQYRKQDLLNISLPGVITSQAKERVNLSVTVNKTKYGLKKINWTVSPNFISKGGAYRETSLTGLEITLPAYAFDTNGTTPQEYHINAVGVDNKGNESNSATTIIRVIPSKKIVSDLTIIPQQSLSANDSDAYTVIAIVSDEHGKPLGNQSITFEVSGLKFADGQPGVTLFTHNSNNTNSKKLTVTTDNKGNAVLNVRSKVAGKGNVIARMENGNYKSSPVNFSADKTSAEISVLKITRDNAVADGSEKNVLYVRVTDKHGNPVDNIPLIFAVTNNAVISNPAPTHTNERGEITIHVTSINAGKSEVTAEVNGRQKRQSVTFVTGKPNADKSELIAQPLQIIANGKMSSTIELHLKDVQGNPISGKKISFTSSLANTRIITTKELGGGVYTAALTGTTAGESAIGVNVNGVVLKVKDVTIMLKADKDNPSAEKSSLFVIPATIIANGKATANVTLTLKDNHGNPISGQAVEFISSLKDSQFSPIKDNGDGTYTATFSGTQVGEATITVKVKSKVLVGKSAVVTLNSDSKTAGITADNLRIIKDNSPADGKTTNSVTATVTDASGHPVPNIDVKFSVSNGAKITTIKAQTDKDGQATATVTSEKAGTYIVTAKVNNKETDKQTTFVADSTTAGVVAVNAQESLKTVGERVPVEITVQDAKSNPVKDTEVILSSNPDTSVTFYKADTGTDVLSQKKATTNASGKVKVYVTSLKTHQITVTANSANKTQDKDNTTAINFTADAPTASIKRVKLNENNRQKVANGTDEFRFIAEVKDKYNNPVPNVMVSWSHDKNNDAILQNHATSRTNNKGEAVIDLKSTIRAVADIQVKAKLKDGAEKPADETVSFMADAATARIDSLITDKSSAIANGVDTIIFTVTVKDEKGNLVSGNEVTVTHQGQAKLVGTINDKIKTNDQGQATFTLTSTTAGQVEVKATNDRHITSKTKTVNFVDYTVTIRIANDINDEPITNAFLDIYKGNIHIGRYTTDKDGKTNPLKLSYGNYKVKITANGFNDETQHMNIEGDHSDVMIQYSMSSNLDKSEIKIVLHWQKKVPKDLDSILIIPSKEVIYWNNKESVDKNVNLDVDKQSAPGFETITIKNLVDGTYTYKVMHYLLGNIKPKEQGYSNIDWDNKKTEATVKLLKNNKLIEEFTINDPIYPNKCLVLFEINKNTANNEFNIRKRKTIEKCY